MVREPPGAQQTLKLPEIPEIPETGLNPVQTACAHNVTRQIGPEPCAKWTVTQGGTQKENPEEH